MDVVIIVPVLRRAHRVEPLTESIRATTPNARVLFVASPNDNAEQEAINAIDDVELWVLPVFPKPGDYQRKINFGVAASDEPLIFLGADDLQFHDGWLEAAAAALAPGIGVVGTNDLGSPRVMAGEHATHSLVTREYAQLGTIDEPGKVLHEGYQHEWCDDEFVATAKHRGAWAFAVDSHVEHLHPNWNKAPIDGLYAKQKSRMRQGRVIFDRRRHLWT